MVELTFKVFPSRSAAYAAVACARLNRLWNAWQLLLLRNGNLMPSIIDLSGMARLYFFGWLDRMKSIKAWSAESSNWGADVSEKSQSDVFWESVNELNWSGQARAFAVKNLTHRQTLEALSAWSSNHTGVDLHVSAAGAVSWVLRFTAGTRALNDFPTQQKAAGLLVRGETDRIGIIAGPGRMFPRQ